MVHHVELFEKLFEAWCRLATVAVKQGFILAFEWPRWCALWQQQRVTDMLRNFGLHFAQFDGCAMNLRSAKGNLMYKPWSIATDSIEIHNELDGKLCSTLPPHAHQPVQGEETKGTENYTWMMCDYIHAGFYAQQLNTAHHRLKYPMKIASCMTTAHIDDDSVSTCFPEDDLLSISTGDLNWQHSMNHSDDSPVMPTQPRKIGPIQHNEIMKRRPIVSAMVHKLLTPKEVRESLPAQHAVQKEVTGLVDLGAWNYSTVRPKAEVRAEARAERQEVHFADVFTICSIKNAELPEKDPLRIHKARAVL
jgi:hypothetical protein